MTESATTVRTTQARPERCRPRPASSSETGFSDDLLVAVGNGDEHAFAQLYDRVAGTVLGTAYAILRDTAQAEEVTEAIFVELWQTAGQYSPDHGSELEWVMAIAHRHTVAWLRSTGGIRSSHDKPDQLTNSSGEPIAAQSGLDALPPVQRESLELAYYGGLTYTEIGHVHHIPAAKARALLRDALISLRDNV